jgi:phage gp29-like protein
MAEKTPGVELREIATVQRDITFPYFGGRLTNRDETLATRGGARGIKIYDDIERDGHAYGVLQKRKLAVTARPWEVLPASDSALDIRAGEIVTRQLKAINFDLLTVNLLDAILKGYSVGEIMWAVEGPEIVAKEMIARDQRRFVFAMQRELRMLTLENLIEGEELPPRKFIAHSFGGKDGTPYGLGIGSKLFWLVYFKRRDITFWLTFADKFGSPTAVGKYPPGTQPSEQTKLLAALSAIAQDTGVIIPDGMLIELLEAKRGGGTDAYEKLAKYMDDQMSICILGETGTTTTRQSGLGQGGVANAQNEVRLELVRADADLLSGTLNKTLLTWITELNVPGATPPTVFRNAEEAKDLAAQATRDKQIFDMGFRPSLKYINDTYGGEWADAPKPPPIPPALPGVSPFPPGAKQPAAFAEGDAVVHTATADQLLLRTAAETLSTEWQKLLGPRVDELIAMAESTDDLVTFRERIADILKENPPPAFIESLARAGFTAALLGNTSDRR